MPDPLVLCVEPKHIPRSKTLDDLRQRFLLFFEQQMNVVPHQAIRIQLELRKFFHHGKMAQKLFAIFIFLENQLPVYAAQ
jgi:hypothetical protein